MFKNKLTGILVILILISVMSAVINTACYNNDNEARVTIHLERNDLAASTVHVKEKYLIDRILEFFSTRAEAVSPPLWNSTHGNLTLTVSSPAFDDKVFVIPFGDTEYSIILPAVQNVTFTIISVFSTVKNWGGHKTISLVPGEQDLNINMIPIPQINLSGGDIAWSDTSSSTNTQSYNLYRSNSSNGPYSLLINTSSNGYFYSPPSGTTYYKVSIISTSGEEGVMSDYVSSTIP